MKKVIGILVVFFLCEAKCFSQNYIENYFVWFDNNLSINDSIPRTHNDSTALCLSLMANPLENINEISIALSNNLTDPFLKKQMIKIITEDGLSYELISSGQKKYFGKPHKHKILLSNSEKELIKFISISTKNTDGSVSTPLNYEIK